VTDLLQAIQNIQNFTVPDLRRRIAYLETVLVNADAEACSVVLARESVSRGLLTGAYLLKRTANQINTVIHTLGILLAIPHILEPRERVEYLSLGAGNTGRAFDLETTHRVAEFKFIDWQGGSETIRQNSLFKDFFLLAEYLTPKRKFLYVLGKEHPLKFLTSNRSLKSVMSRNNPLWTKFQNQYSNRFTTVGEYFSYRQNEVRLEDISAILDDLIQLDDTPTPEDKV
jgi:hypothetical protein